jgi:hypothetical protein
MRRPGSACQHTRVDDTTVKDLLALYASFITMATRIERTWLRRTVIGVCSLIPALVAYARIYRGMHLDEP